MEDEQAIIGSMQSLDEDVQPIRYIDSMRDGQHVGLFYEDSEYARILEFRFIKNGLEQGQQCVYATTEDSGSIILKMLSYGVPLKYFQTGMLKIYQIHDMDCERMRDSCRKDIGKILSDVVSPFRMVSRILCDVSTKDAMSAGIELECSIHGDFEGFGGSLLCPYNLGQIAAEDRAYWQNKIIGNHHAVIMATKFGEGTVLLPKSANGIVQEKAANKGKVCASPSRVA